MTGILQKRKVATWIILKIVVANFAICCTILSKLVKLNVETELNQAKRRQKKTCTALSIRVLSSSGTYTSFFPMLVAKSNKKGQVKRLPPRLDYLI